MKALIDDPNTNENVRKIAQGKLAALLGSETIYEYRPPRIKVRTNVSDSDLDLAFTNGARVGDLYDALSSLTPGPQEIHFLRQGVVKMVVPPPFTNITRESYYHMIKSACPSVHRIAAHHLGNEGYLFTLSFF
jgi:hypothetical protein